MTGACGAKAARLALLSSLVLCAGCAHDPGVSDGRYRYFFVGDPDTPVSLPERHPDASLALMGGGPDVDAAFRWLIRRAGVKPGTGGRFVVLRASGTEAYNPYVFYGGPGLRSAGPAQWQWVGGAALGLSAVETLVLPSRAAANDAFVNAIVRRANVVFIAGGDQSRYLRFWKGTALDRTLSDLLGRNVPIGGTSAGLAMLGEYSFTALQGTIDSAAALSDPFDPRITIDPSPGRPGKGFLTPEPLQGIITDSHFDRRKRMGRLIAFLSRLGGAGDGAGCAAASSAAMAAQGGTPAVVKGIGVSEQAALLIESTANGGQFLARRIKNPWARTDGAVYFVRPLTAPKSCGAGHPLSIEQVEIRKLADSSAIFNLSDWSGVEAYVVHVEDGDFDASPY